jgi:hypothetical protein
MSGGATREAITPMETQKQFCCKSFVEQELRQASWRDSTLSRAKTHGVIHEAVTPNEAPIQYRCSSFSR